MVNTPSHPHPTKSIGQAAPTHASMQALRQAAMKHAGQIVGPRMQELLEQQNGRRGAMLVAFLTPALTAAVGPVFTTHDLPPEVQTHVDEYDPTR